MYLAREFADRKIRSNIVAPGALDTDFGGGRTDEARKQLGAATAMGRVGQADDIGPWFKHDEFFAEANRVLRPTGVLAFWCYELCTITPEIDAVVMKLYKDALGPFWEPERKLVEEGYGSVCLPMQEITPPEFQMTADWSLEHLVGAVQLLTLVLI